MIAKLTTDMAAALNASGTAPVEVRHPETNATYYLVDAKTHHDAMEALRREEDRRAIAEGIAQMEAGDSVSLEEARRLTRERLLSRKR